MTLDKPGPTCLREPLTQQQPALAAPKLYPQPPSLSFARPQKVKLRHHGPAATATTAAAAHLAMDDGARS